MTKAFDTALFVPQPVPDVGQAPGINVIGPPFDTEWYYYVIAPGPGIEVDASIPAATDVNQILLSGPSPGFQWLTSYPLYLGALPAPPSTNPAPGAPHVPAAGTMYFNTSDGTPYILTFDPLTQAAIWVPLPVATTDRVTIAASLPAATLSGQMLIAGPPGNAGGRTIYPWQASVGPFLGAHPTSPTMSPGSNPIPVGSFYYNLTNSQVYVWNGSSWQSITIPAKAATASLFYQSIAAQTVFFTSNNDLFGQSYTLNVAGTEGIEVYLNGVRLTPVGGSVAGDYTVDYASSAIILSTAAPTGSVVVIDVLQDPMMLGPTLVLREKLQSLAFDGVATTFTLLAMSGAGIIVGDGIDLNVSLDGVIQDPGVDYVIDATGSQIIFTQPPSADAQDFIVYFSKSAVGFLSAVEHDNTMFGDGTAANPLGSVSATDTQRGVVFVPGLGGTTPDALTVGPSGEMGMTVAAVPDIVAGTDNVQPVTALTLRSVTGDDVANLDTTVKTIVPAVNETLAQANLRVLRAGDTMTGALVLPTDPTLAMEAATKQYVDQVVAASALYQGVWHVASNTPDLTPATMNPLNGYSWIAQTVDPLTPETAPAGLPGIGGMSIDSGDRVLWDAAAVAYDVVKGSSLSIQEASALFVDVAGDIMTGPLVLPADPTSALEATTKQYVDAGDTNLDTLKVNRAGDTLTGALVLPGDPTIGLQATTKDYVDNLVATDALYQGAWQVAGNSPDLTPGVTNPLNDYSWVCQTVNPQVPEMAPAALPGIGGQMIDSGWVVYWDAAASQYDLIKGPQLSLVTAQTTFVQKAGDVMGGPLSITNSTTGAALTIVNATPGGGAVQILDQTDDDAVTINKSGAGNALVTGGTIVCSAPVNPIHVATKGYVDTQDALRVAKSGDTMTGGLLFGSVAQANVADTSRHLTLWGSGTSGTFGLGISSGRLNYRVSAANNSHAFGWGTTDWMTISSSGVTLPALPTANMHAAAKQYVDQQDALQVSKTGDTMTGNLNFSTVGQGLTLAGGSAFYSSSSGNLGLNTGTLSINAAMTMNGQLTALAQNIRMQNAYNSAYGGWSLLWTDNAGRNLLSMKGNQSGSIVGGNAEGTAEFYTWNGGWGQHRFMWTTVNSPVQTYFEGSVNAPGFNNTSSRKLKTNIRPLDVTEAEEAFAALKPVKFDWAPLPRAEGQTIDDPPRAAYCGFVVEDMVGTALEPILNKEKGEFDAYDVTQVLTVAVAEIKRLGLLVEELRARVSA